MNIHLVMAFIVGILVVLIGFCVWEIIKISIEGIAWKKARHEMDWHIKLCHEKRSKK